MKRVSAILFSALLLLVMAAPARAAVDMYLQFEGIPGESTDLGYESSIEILAWSWGASNSISHGPGGGVGRANFQDLSLTKYLDSTSVPLFASLVQGHVIDSAALDVIGTSGKTSLSFTDVFITSLSMGGSGGEDRLTENATFTFRTVTFQTFAPNPAGGFFPGPIFGWDTLTGEALPVSTLSPALSSVAANVPEPSTWLLMGAGLALLGLSQGRRSRGRS